MNEEEKPTPEMEYLQYLMEHPELTPTDKIEREAMNIVYQIGDILEASVEKRQATNDEAIDFVMGFLTQARQQGIEEVNNFYITKPSKTLSTISK